MRVLTALGRNSLLNPRVLQPRSFRSLNLSRRLAIARNMATGPAKPDPKASSQTITRSAVMKELGASLGWTIGGTITTVLFMVSAGFIYEQCLEVAELDPPGTITSVSVNGKEQKIHVLYHKCKSTTQNTELDQDSSSENLPQNDQSVNGNAAPTVILDGSIGQTSFDWSKVDDEISRFANVLVIDRPGLGLSGPAKAVVRTAEQISEEYVTLLEQIHVRGDIVLVGQGSGGLNMRLLAEKLEQGAVRDVSFKGIVLVDSQEEQAVSDIQEEFPEVKKAMQSAVENTEMLVMLAKFGLVRFFHAFEWSKKQNKYAEKAKKSVRFFSPTTKQRYGISKEMASLSETEKSFQDRAASPTVLSNSSALVVLSHGIPDLFYPLLPLNQNPTAQDEIVPKLEAIWQQGQRKLLDINPSRSVLRVVDGSGHDIHQEKPQEVVAAVLAVVNEISGNFEAGIRSLQTKVCKEDNSQV